MNISINCKVSLSKKLRAILGKEATLTLVSQDIVDGKGTAIISIDSEGVSDSINVSEIGETSIMLTPVEMAYESPNSESQTHSSIFSSISQLGHSEKLVEKIAVVHAPERGQESRAVKKEADIPKEFSQLKTKECVSWIKSMEELVIATNSAKNKKSQIDVDSAQNDRERLILQEAKEKEEAIDNPAWIVNDKVGMLTINDIGISLSLNSPYDLSSISARKLASSKDLKSLVKEGYVRFVSPEEKDEIIINASEEEITSIGLDVFDNHESAMENIQEPRAKGNTGRKAIINERTSVDITEENMDEATEEESMIINLTQSLPPIKRNNIIGEGKKTVHGNIARPQINQRPSQPSQPSITPKVHKTVRNVG